MGSWAGLCRWCSVARAQNKPARHAYCPPSRRMNHADLRKPRVVLVLSLVEEPESKPIRKWFVLSRGDLERNKKLFLCSFHNVCAACQGGERELRNVVA